MRGVIREKTVVVDGKKCRGIGFFAEKPGMGIEPI
jgi:hypothetical protein